MESNWKDYFSFTKKERTGIYVLLILIAICIAIPQFFKTATFSEEVRVAVMQIQKVPPEQVSKYKDRRSPYHNNKESGYNDVYYEPEGEEPVKGTLFPFDPNTLDAAGWKKLGINDRTARTIQNYLVKGGQFRTAADLQKIYSLRKKDFDRLMPYVRIATPPPLFTPGKPPVKYEKSPPTIIDINEADTAAFIALPGIGSKLASRIVNFRERLGGFYSVQQIGETFGLPDSTFQLILARLQCRAVVLQKININTADVNTLKQHPYIRWNIANAIVQYRQQHRQFRSTGELQQIVLITPEIYQKLAAYVTVE